MVLGHDEAATVGQGVPPTDFETIDREPPGDQMGRRYSLSYVTRVSSRRSNSYTHTASLAAVIVTARRRPLYRVLKNLGQAPVRMVFYPGEPNTVTAVPIHDSTTVCARCGGWSII
jgi:hypothetical protein